MKKEKPSVEEAIRKIRANWAEGDRKRDDGVVDPEGLVQHRDLRYGPHEENMLDIYYPEGPDRANPTIVSIHGGGWCYGSKALYSHYCLRMAKRGFTVVNFDYRLAPEHKYPAPLEDCCRVLGWMQENAANYQINLNNVFLVGDSAGGQLAFQLLTMLTSESYRAFFDFAPPLNFRFNACGLNCGCYFMPISKFLSPKKVGGLFEAYFPEDYLPWVPSLKAEKYITGDFPPAFVMTSRNDYLRMMAPPLHRKLKRKGVETVLRIYGEKSQKEIGHVFHLNCKSELADQCNDDQCAFFRQHLKA